MSASEIQRVATVVLRAIGEIPLTSIGKELPKIVAVILEYVDHVLGLVEKAAAEKALTLIEGFLKSKGYKLSVDQRDSLIGMIDCFHEVATDQTKIGVPPRTYLGAVEKSKKKRFSLAKLFQLVKKKPA